MTLKERKALIKKLDKLWSQAVKDKANNICEKCQRVSKGLNSHHVVGRRYMSTRYLIENGVALCVNCHFNIAHQNPVEFSKWILAKRGEEWYNRLQFKKQTIKVDLGMVKIQLEEHKKKLEEIPYLHGSYPGHNGLQVQSNRREL